MDTAVYCCCRLLSLTRLDQTAVYVVYSFLTFIETWDYGTVHGQAKRVACLPRELLCILGPLPAVSVRAEEKLLIERTNHKPHNNKNVTGSV